MIGTSSNVTMVRNISARSYHIVYSISVCPLFLFSVFCTYRLCCNQSMSSFFGQLQEITIDLPHFFKKNAAICIDSRTFLRRTDYMYM